jgi:hypothetical protein
MQTPQGLDAKHSDEMFPVKREYTGVNSGVRRALFSPNILGPTHLGVRSGPFGVPKILANLVNAGAVILIL